MRVTSRGLQRRSKCASRATRIDDLLVQVRVWDLGLGQHTVYWEPHRLGRGARGNVGRAV